MLWDQLLLRFKLDAIFPLCLDSMTPGLHYMKIRIGWLVKDVWVAGTAQKSSECPSIARIIQRACQRQALASKLDNKCKGLQTCGWIKIYNCQCQTFQNKLLRINQFPQVHHILDYIIITGSTIDAFRPLHIISLSEPEMKHFILQNKDA